MTPLEALAFASTCALTLQGPDAAFYACQAHALASTPAAWVREGGTPSTCLPRFVLVTPSELSGPMFVARAAHAASLASRFPEDADVSLYCGVAGRQGGWVVLSLVFCLAAYFFLSDRRSSSPPPSGPVTRAVALKYLATYGKTLI